MKKDKSSERIRDAERTKKILKQAAVDQLISNGFAGLSIIPIIKTAGVSRGALFHHYPTKDHLIAAAFEDLLTEFAHQLHSIGAELRAGKISLYEFIVKVSDTMASDLFIGSMEIALGIRSELSLSSLVENAVLKWRQSLFDFWVTTFDLPDYDTEETIVHWAMASNTLRGHAFSSTFGVEAKVNERLYVGFTKLFLRDAVVRAADQNILDFNH